jgi:hypothetical protein
MDGLVQRVCFWEVTFFQALLRHRGKTIYTKDLSSNGFRQIHDGLCQTRDFDWRYLGDI